MANQNTSEYLEKIKTRLFENLRMIPHAPGVQMQPIPEDVIPADSDGEDEEDQDKRISIRASDKRIACDEEFSDSEDEGDGRRDIRLHIQKRKRPREEDREGKEKDADPEVKREREEDTSKVRPEDQKDAHPPTETGDGERKALIEGAGDKTEAKTEPMEVQEKRDDGVTSTTTEPKSDLKEIPAPTPGAAFVSDKPEEPAPKPPATEEAMEH